MATLHGAIALTEIDRILVLVGHDLDFNVARVLQEFFHVDRRIAKGRPGFRLGHLHRVDQRRFGMHHAHATATAATCRLDDDRVTHRLGNAPDAGWIVRQFTFGTGHTGHAGTDHGLLGRDLVTHDADGLGCWANELKTTLLHPFGKVGVFTQEAVARVNCLGVCHLGSRDDGRHIQITQARCGRTDADRLFRQLDVFGIPVRFRIDHYRLDAQLAARALDPQGYFATVGDQYFFEHVRVGPGLFDDEQGLAVLDRLPVFT